MKALILAGGFATRLWPITEQRAKPLLIVNGKTILHHLLKGLQGFDPEDIIVLTNQKFEKPFREELTKLGFEKSHIFIEDAQNEGAKLGALKAVSECLQHFDIQENIAILAGDNILTEFHISDLEIAPHQAKIITREVESLHEARKFGVLQCNDTNQVIDFEEKPEHPKSKLVSTGFMSLGVQLFDVLTAFTKIQPDNLGGIFARLLETEVKSKHDFEILAHTSPGQWFDIGSFETYLEAHTALQSQDLLQGINSIQKNNTFSGKVAIAPGCDIQNCTIIDSIIYPHVRLHNCQLSRCIIDENTDLSGVDLNHKIVRHNTTLQA